MASTQFQASVYDKKHARDMRLIQGRVMRTYEALCKKIAIVGISTGFSDADKEFYLKDFPGAEKQIMKLLEGLSGDITQITLDGIEQAWELSNAKNSEMVKDVADRLHLPEEKVSQWTPRNMDALSQFKARTVNGMGLSERVWDFIKNDKDLFEMALEVGLGEGKSAAALSRDIRKYLKEPNKLFRRVRDKDGNLRLSKAAQAYHPGQGVYRSSYKNALRMTATETNMAYRTADHLSQNNVPWVVGIEIKTSAVHASSDVQGKAYKTPYSDICDELKGVYPKEFKFVGWHPFCRCYVVTKLASREEMSKFAQLPDDEQANYQFADRVKDVPDNFKQWMKDNEERIARAKSMPYFIKDNYVDGKPENGLRFTQSGHKLTPKEIAKIRHEARTKEDIDSIQERWNRYRLKRDDCYRDVERYEEFQKEYGFSIDPLNEVLRNPLVKKSIGKYVYYPDVDKLFDIREELILEAMEKADKRKDKLIKIADKLRGMGAQGKKQAERIDKYFSNTLSMDNRYAFYNSDSFQAYVNNMNKKLNEIKKHRTDVQERWNKRIKPDLKETDLLGSTNAMLDILNVEYNEVGAMKKLASNNEIIAYLGGGDKTTGSCSSLALAFAGNKGGFKVLDFRGGDSLDFFSSKYNIEQICSSVGGLKEIDIDSLVSAKKILTNVVEGKYYYFCHSRHAAIVRRVNGELQYLELQSANDNGFHNLTDNELEWRFGYSRMFKYNSAILIDIDKLNADKGFKKLLGYINTDEAKQNKGKSGTIK